MHRDHPRVSLVMHAPWAKDMGTSGRGTRTWWRVVGSDWQRLWLGDGD